MAQMQGTLTFFTETPSQYLDFRESALPRIATCAALTTLGGFYAGTTILSKAL